MTHFMQGAFVLLTDWAIEGAVLLGGVWLLARMMRRAPAAGRHLAWGMGTIGLLLLPAISTLLPGWGVLPRSAGWLAPAPAPATASAGAVAAAPGSDAADAWVPVHVATPAAARRIASPPARGAGPAESRQAAAVGAAPRLGPAPHSGPAVSLPPARVQARAPLPVRNWIVIVWIMGAAARLLPVLISAVALFLLSRRTSPAAGPLWEESVGQAMGSLALKRRPLLLASSGAAMPMTWGILRARVLLPADAAQWPTARQRIVLLHELAHVKRHDCAWLLIARLACAACWYNPLAWHALSRLRIEAERACDDRVLRAGQPAPDYAEQLIGLAASLRIGNWAGPIAAGMARSSTLEGRLRAILDGTRDRRALTRSGAVVVIGLLACIVFVASLLHFAARPTRLSESHAPGVPGIQMANARTVPVLALSETGYPRNYVSFGTAVRLPSHRDLKGRDGRYQLRIPDPSQSHWHAVSGSTRTMALFTVPPGPISKPLVVRLNLGAAPLTGRVTDGHGNGVVGREVQLRATPAGGEAYLFEPVKTDGDGYYEVYAAPVGNGVLLQTALVSAAGADQAWSSGVATYPGEPAVRMADLIDPHPTQVSQQPPWRNIGGVVRDENGRPVSNAAIMAICSIATPGGMPVSRQELAATDPAGRWSTPIPPHTVRIALRVSHPGFIEIADAPNGTVPTQDLNRGKAVIVLHKGLTLVGQVRDGQGKPVPDALVTTQNSMTILVFGGPVEDASMGRTDARGTFHVDGMTPGPRALTVYAPGFPAMQATANIVPNMKPARITVQAGGGVAGIVVDAAGRPVAGARVGTRGAHSTTDAAGHFTLDGLPARGVFAISASRGRGVSGNVENAHVGGGPYRIVLLPMPVIRGKVVDDATGAPITHFQTQLGVRDGPGEDIVFFPSDRQENTSRDGTFQRQSTRPAALVRVRADGHLPAQTPIVRAGESPAPFVLRLKPAADITGTVVGPDGAPAAGAGVAWIAPDRHAFVSAAGKLDDFYLASPEIVVKTDTAGRFTLPLSPTPGTIFAIDPAKGYAQQSSGDFQQGRKIQLTAWASIKGTLDLGNGHAPVRRVQIVIVDPNLRARSAPVNWMLSQPVRADGSFNFDHVPAAALAVGLPAVNGLSHRVVLTPEPGQTRVIRMGGSGRPVEGTLALSPDLGFDRVYSAYGRDRPLVTVDLRPVSDPQDLAVRFAYDSDPVRVLFAGAVPDGLHFRIDAVPPGDYVLHIAIRAAPTPQSQGVPHVLAEATRPVSVAPAAPDSPVQIGQLRLRRIDVPRQSSTEPSPGPS